MLKKEKSESRIILIWSICVMSIGLTVLLTTPFLNKWFDLKIDDFNFSNLTLPSGYAICTIGLLIELIYVLPSIIQALKGIKK